MGVFIPKTPWKGSPPHGNGAQGGHVALARIPNSYRRYYSLLRNRRSNTIGHNPRLCEAAVGIRSCRLVLFALIIALIDISTGDRRSSTRMVADQHSIRLSSSALRPISPDHGRLTRRNLGMTLPNSSRQRGSRLALISNARATSAADDPDSSWRTAVNFISRVNFAEGRSSTAL